MTELLDVRGAPPSEPASHTGSAPERAVQALSLAGVACALTTATYLYFGYIFGAWPSTALLDFVVRIKGELRNDWQTTNQPAPHWVMAHFLALFPDSWLRGAVFAVSLLGFLVLWAGLAEICRALDVDRVGALAIGLVAVPTAFGGIGVSDPIFQTMYPNQTAFAFSVAGLGAALWRRPLLAGAFAGAGVLVHPSAGALGVPVVAAAAFGMLGWSWRAAARFVVPVVLLALPAVVPVVVDQGPPSHLSTRARFELLAVVRQPHHVLYGDFPSYEYVRTALWIGLAAVATALLWRRRPARALALAGAVAIAGILVGAMASVEKGPLIIVQAELPRLSPYLVLVGIVVAGAAVIRLAGYWGAALLGAIPVVVHAVASGVPRTWMSVSGAEAVLVLVVLAASLVVRRVAVARLEVWLLALAVVTAALLFAFAVTSTSYLNLTPHLALLELRARRSLGLASLLALLGAATCVAVAARFFSGRGSLRLVVAIAAVVAVVGANAAALVRAEAYGTPLSPDDAAWRQIAAATRSVSQPSDIVLTPPQNSGFRFFAQRPVVVEFGSFRYDAQDVHWAQRIADATGDPRTVSPSFGTDVAARNRLIADDYDRHVERSRLPICRYHVAFVVAQAPVHVPPWLVRVTANRFYTLLRVKHDAC